MRADRMLEAEERLAEVLSDQVLLVEGVARLRAELLVAVLAQ